MNPACELCRGACCEAIVLPVKVQDPDIQRWIEYHGQPTDRGIYFECKCSKLKDGKCSIYEDRPKVCRVFEVGSAGCLTAIKRRRPEQETEIRRLIEDSRSDTDGKDG